MAVQVRPVSSFEDLETCRVDARASTLEDEKADEKDMALDTIQAVRPKNTILERIAIFLARWGVETRGVDPIPPEKRTDLKLYNFFAVWFTVSMNIPTFNTGAAGPAFFGLGVRDSLVIILIADLFACALPAYIAVFGPKLGMRSMVVARYSWGYYGAMIPTVLTVFSMIGLAIVNVIAGGQILASVSTRLDDTLGIVIISLITFGVCFGGYKLIHWYESISWIPNVLAFIVMLGVGGKDLVNVPTSGPVSVSTIVTFATTTAAANTCVCIMTPDFGVYHKVSGFRGSLRVFLYVYLGLFVGCLGSQYVGVVFAASAMAVPSWEAGFQNGTNPGGLVRAILRRAGPFGDVLTVLVALTLPGTCAPNLYVFGASLMTVSSWANKVPRYMYLILSQVIIIPVAIIGATTFFTTFVDVLNYIAYWTTIWGVMLALEHIIFRKSCWSNYDIADWNRPHKLPLGFAAVVSFLCGCGIVVPSMAQVWYTGPIASAGTGDIGILTGSVVVLLTYPPLRALEKRLTTR